MTLPLKLKIAFSTLFQPLAYCNVFQSPPWFFIRPSSDGSYYGRVMSVRVSVRPTLRPSGSPSARFSLFSQTCFDILSWNFAHDFGLMYYGSCSSVVTLRQFIKELWLFVNSEYRLCAVFRTFLLHALTYCADILHLIFVLMYYEPNSSVVTLRQCLKELCPFVNLDYREYAVFPHFFPSYFDILSGNFANDFVLMNYRSSSSVVTLSQFLKELCLFMNLEYRKCEVFRTFLLHALRHWAEIVH